MPLLHRVGRPAGIDGGFTTRHGGVGTAPFDSFNLAQHVGDDLDAVATNRARLATELGLSTDALVFAEQVHGRDVVVVEGPMSAPPVADALVSATPGLALVVLVADCVPVLLADPGAGVVAVAHAGRRGVQLDVVGATVAAMRSLGARPASIEVHLGPAIGGCCYEVPADLQRAVAAVAPETIVGAGRTRTGASGLDLRSGVRGQLARIGVTRVETIGGCTMDDPDLFSYRRAARTGRFAGVLRLRPGG